MIPTDTPRRLVEKCLQLARSGNRGVLISGGCDQMGCLPWLEFVDAIAEVKRRTDLLVSIHSGLVDDTTALALKDAGVDQALIDVIGADETLKNIYHVDFGVDRIATTLGALNRAQLPIIPHIVCGLDYGRMIGEHQAVAMLADHEIDQLVIVSLMRLPGTPMHGITAPSAEAVAELIAQARLSLPDVRLSLGCARQRGSHRLEMLAIDAGINRMAIPSEEAIDHAMQHGLKIKYQRTCCSVAQDYAQPQW
jgi:uncharacterized radical SAM superfamily protein